MRQRGQKTVKLQTRNLQILKNSERMFLLGLCVLIFVPAEIMIVSW